MSRTIELLINGEPRTLTVLPHQTLLEALRNAGLTGTKRGCDKGDCGACSVLVDNKPTLSCSTLVMSVQGKRIETVEGALSDPHGRALHNALGRTGGAQCGFCTPGVMMSGIALLRRNQDPSLNVIKRALSGNLCRCTGYSAIYDGVREACGNNTARVCCTDNAGTSVGQPHVKLDHTAIASGRALYTDDISLPNMLHGAILRSPHAHARILAIDASAALAINGVRAVLTGDDFERTYGIFPYLRDETVLARDKVRYVGEAVAVVAAESAEIAIAACRAIKVEYEPLPFVLDAFEALRENAPLIHETDYKDRQSADNVANEAILPEFGDLETGFQNAAVTVQGHWHYGGSNHSAIEPHCAIGEWRNDHLRVWSSTQVSNSLKRELAHVLCLREEQVRVTQPKVGGGFGGKSDLFDIEFCAAELSRLTGQPVKILASREEVYALHRGRHPIDYDLELACNNSGQITALKLDAVLNGGAFFSYGFVTRYYALQLLAPLRISAFTGRSRRVYTNTAPCGPKRGHGGPQLNFAVSTAVDEAAEKLGINPMNMLRRNILGAGEQTVNGFVFPSSGIRECMDAVEKASKWQDRYNAMPSGRGLGAAVSYYISGTAYPINPENKVQTTVALDVESNGSLKVRVGSNDIGQGSDTMLAIAVSEIIGFPVSQITVASGDTDLPVDIGAYSSRLTYMSGKAAFRAALALREKLVAKIACRWGVAEEKISCSAGFYTDSDNPAHSIKVREALMLIANSTYHGRYETENVIAGEYRGATIGASPTYSMTAYIAEVFVDEQTGRVTVTDIWCAHDCGRAISPIAVKGQIEGSVYMAASEAIMERMEYNPETGLNVGPNLLDSPIPTTLDTPNIHAIIVESNDPNGPFGAKEAGEGPALGVVGAIANAVAHATGVRLRSVPFTPEKVLNALKERRAGKKEVE